MSKSIKLDKVILDPDCQPRLTMSSDLVNKYAEAMIEGAEFPPIVVFKDEAGKHWCADGFHRVTAYRKADRGAIQADVRSGEKEDAVCYSLGANDTHGLNRTNADKRNAVERALRHWPEWSDSEIARRCNVSHPFVGKSRALTCNVTSDTHPIASTERKIVDKHGNIRTMETKNIGRKAKAEPDEDDERVTPISADVEGEIWSDDTDEDQTARHDAWEEDGEQEWNSNDEVANVFEYITKVIQRWEEHSDDLFPLRAILTQLVKRTERKR